MSKYTDRSYIWIYKHPATGRYLGYYRIYKEICCTAERPKKGLRRNPPQPKKSERVLFVAHTFENAKLLARDYDTDFGYLFQNP